MRFRLRSLLLLVLVAGVFFAAFALVRDTSRKIKHIKNANTIGWVAEMIGNHLEANKGEWPTNWDDLDDDYLEVVCQFGQSWQYEELKDCVEVTWQIKPMEIREQTSEKPTFLRFRDGYSFPESEQEANARVVEHIEALHK